MASYRALATVSQSIVELLRASYDPADFNNELEFKTFTAKDFASPFGAGVSVFLFRVFPNGVQRTPPGRFGPDGNRRYSELPVDLHYLLTVWAKEASLQHTVTGWMMRVLEDMPVLSAAQLNASGPGVFRDDETVELSLAELRNEDLLKLWDVLDLNVFQLSVPYVARGVRIESFESVSSGREIQERLYRTGVVEVRAV